MIAVVALIREGSPPTETLICPVNPPERLAVTVNGVDPPVGTTTLGGSTRSV
jgi:hypothetical protein